MESKRRVNSYLPLERVSKFLNNKNVTMVVVSQHHNCSFHWKVITLPLGVYGKSRAIWRAMKEEALIVGNKSNLLFSASSNWGFRPMVLACIKEKVGDNLVISRLRLSTSQYFKELARSAGVIAISGFGADSFRLALRCVIIFYITLTTIT